GGCCSEIRGCPTPGGTLGDCRSEWKRRSHPHRSDANWVKTAIDESAIVAGINSGPLFRAINKAGRVWGNGFTPKVIWSIVKEGSRQLRSCRPCSTRACSE